MITIVGGAGFIGSRLAKRLEESNLPFEIADIGSDRRSVDVRDEARLGEAVNGDTVINLAAVHRDDVKPESSYYEVNVGGARNLCSVAEKKGIERIIFTSSVAVYGFAPPGTDESGRLNPFNDYGRSKLQAEAVYREWHARAPERRTLVIVRPTVVFGEGNRGNVYNLLRQIASGRFFMVGNGKNVKSMAYVENVASFLSYCLRFESGLHVFNYVDKPDFDMNTLVASVNQCLGRNGRHAVKLPYLVGLAGGYFFDLLSAVTGRKFPISSIRVRKFCSDSSFETAASRIGFVPPVPLAEALRRTVAHEFPSVRDR